VRDVHVIAMAYAWRMQGVSYVLSTCGSKKLYISHFEDSFGNVAIKEIICPKLVHLIYDYFPSLMNTTKSNRNFLVLLINDSCDGDVNCQFSLNYQELEAGLGIRHGYFGFL